MRKTFLGQHGVGHILVLVGVVVVAVIGFAGYRVLHTQKPTEAENKQAETSQVTSAAWPTEPEITWEATGQGEWISLPYDAKVPDCPNPLRLELPTPDAGKATSLLYPGQTRSGTFEGKGGNYKPHGGLRFDKNTDNNIAVVMPFNGSVFRGNRVLVGGEIQYSFDIANACGVMIRLGHLRDLTPEFQAIADKFAPAAEGDSRTTKITPTIAFKTGAKIATAVGFKTTKNVGFDYGVYNLRTNNEASKDATYKAAHADTAELSFHALCWIDLLNSQDARTIKALPAADQLSGKDSDYCK